MTLPESEQKRIEVNAKKWYNPLYPITPIEGYIAGATAELLSALEREKELREEFERCKFSHMLTDDSLQSLKKEFKKCIDHLASEGVFVGDYEDILK